MAFKFDCGAYCRQMALIGPEPVASFLIPLNDA
jgi:hypothetical protein